jgi:hypothetical protein
MAAVPSHFNRQGGALISIACHSEENFLWVFERKCRLTSRSLIYPKIGSRNYPQIAQIAQIKLVMYQIQLHHNSPAG